MGVGIPGIRKKSTIQTARSVANSLAVNCHAQLRAIEALDGWHKHSDLSQWHLFFEAAQEVLSHRPKKPEPAEAPPSHAMVSDQGEMSGSAGGGEGTFGGECVPTALTTWNDVIGAR